MTNPHDTNRTQCEQCGTQYGTLQRSTENHLYSCRECGHESCERCVVKEPLGSQVWFLSCPFCSAKSLDLLNLTDRFSIYASIADLAKTPHVIAMLFTPRSVYAKRSEVLINEILPKLDELTPTFLLLDEDDAAIQKSIAEWFPSIFTSARATSNGTIIWFCNGKPVDFLPRRPHLSKLEILNHSRRAWTQRSTA